MWLMQLFVHTNDLLETFVLKIITLRAPIVSFVGF